MLAKSFPPMFDFLTKFTQQSDVENAVFLPSDSPGVPPSATAHELFRGFSYVAPTLLDDVDHSTTVVCNTQALTTASLRSSLFNPSTAFVVLL